MSASSENVTGGGALEPLRNPVFRMLWLAWLAANISLWMHDVAAAWLMTTLTRDPALVALVATAGTLPMFLLGMPSGALADIVDRRNRHLLESKTVDDLPDLVNRTRELAELFAPKPLLLLDAAQKRVMVPDLLRSFLVVQLIDRGWQSVFSFWEGFRLTCGSVEIDPARVVYELGDGALSRDEFRALLTAGR